MIERTKAIVNAIAEANGEAMTQEVEWERVRVQYNAANRDDARCLRWTSMRDKHKKGRLELLRSCIQKHAEREQLREVSLGSIMGFAKG